ncbi:MAG: hypothetical protein ACRDF4_10880 [Rhabdochlamydiaceae bacterium]
MQVNVIQQKTLKDGTKLGMLASIKLEDVKPFDKLQDKGDETNKEKLVRVWRGSKKNIQLFVGVDSDYGAANYGGRFYLIGFNVPDDAARVVAVVKDGILVLYKVLDKNGNEDGADYSRTLEIVNEVGGELPAHQTLISALDQNDAAKNNVKGKWCYVKGINGDLGKLADDIYTWGEVQTKSSVGKTVNTANLELKELQEGIEKDRKEKESLEKQLAEKNNDIANKEGRAERLKKALEVLERKE